MSQLAIGINGRANWRVSGSMREMRMSVAMAVFMMGPGEDIIDKEKMPRMMSIRYCPS